MKNRPQLEAELAEVEGKIGPLSRRLDSLLETFASSIVPDVDDWISSEARRQIEGNHAKVNAGGIELVRAIKADLSALKEMLPEVCRKALGPPERWPHNTALKEQDFYTASHNDFFSGVFRRAISPLGSVLYEHGLLDDRSSDKSWKRASLKGYEYAYNPGFDSRRHESTSAYRDLLKSQWELKKTASNLKEDIEKAKTRELWDEA